MQNIKELKAKAQSFIELKEYKKAIELFYKLLTYNSRDEETLLNIALTFCKMDNFERSKDYYTKILTFNPESLKALRGLAKLYKKYKKVEKSLECIDKALNIEKSLEDIEFKALLFIKLEKSKEALDILMALLNEKEPNNSILNSIAICNLNLGNKEKAIEYYQKSIDLKDNNSANIGLARVYLEIDLKKSKEFLENLIEKDFNDIKAHYLLAEVFYQQKKYEKAIAQYNLILTIKNNDVEVLNKLGVTYSEIGWHDQAIKVYQEALKIAPYDKDVRYALAYTYFINEEYSKAKRELSKNNEHKNSLILVAQIDFNESKFSSAIEILENLVKEDETNNKAIELLAKTYDAIDLKEKALSFYEQALRLGSKDIQIKFKVAVFLKEKGNLEKAFELLNEVLDVDEFHIDANLNLAEILYEFKNYETVLVLLNKLLEKNKNIVEIYPIGAKASLAINNLDLARDFLYESIKKSPSNPQGYYLTGIFMEKLGEPDEAENFYEEAINLDENNLVYINAFANYYYQHYDFESALKWFKRSLALKIDEDNEIKYLNCLVELRQNDRLKKYLKKAKSKKLDALFIVYK